MGSKGRTIKYTVDIETHLTDISDEIKKYESDIQGLQNKIKNGAGSKELEKKIQILLNKVSSLKQSYVSAIKDLSSAKLDSAEFENFQKVVDNRLQEVNERMIEVERSVSLLSNDLKSFDAGEKFAKQIEPMERKMKDLMKDMRSTMGLVKDFQEMMNIKFNDKELAKITKAALKLNNFDLSMGSVEETTSSVEELEQELENLADKYDEMNDKLAKSGSGSVSRQLQKQMTDNIAARAKIIKQIAKIKGDTYNPYNVDYETNFGPLKEVAENLQSDTDILLDQLIESKKELEQRKKDLDDTVSTTAASFHFKDGGIRIPVLLDPSGIEKMQSSLDDLVNTLNIYAKKNPVDIVFRLFPMGGKRSEEKELAKAIKDIRVQIPKTNDPELQKSLNSFVDNLEKQYQQALQLNIAINLNESADSIKKKIEEIRKAANEKGINILPHFIVSEEEEKKLKEVLQKVQSDFSFDIAKDVGEMAKQLNKLLDSNRVETWGKAFVDVLSNIESKLQGMKDLIQPLADLTVSQNIKNKRGRPSKETVENRSYVAQFTSALDALNKALLEKKKIDSQSKEFINDVQNKLKDEKIEINITPKTGNFIDDIQKHINGKPVEIDIKPILTNDSVNALNSETDAVNNVKHAFEVTSGAKNDFAKANDNVYDSAIHSTDGLENEKKILDEVKESSVSSKPSNVVKQNIEDKKEEIQISKEEIVLQKEFNDLLNIYLQSLAQMRRGGSDKLVNEAQAKAYALIKRFPRFEQVQEGISEAQRERLFDHYYQEKTGKVRDKTHYSNEAIYDIIKELIKARGTFSISGKDNKDNRELLGKLIRNFIGYQEAGGKRSLTGLTSNKRIQKNLENEYKRQIELIKKNTEAKQENAIADEKQSDSSAKQDKQISDIQKQTKEVKQNTEAKQENKKVDQNKTESDKTIQQKTNDIKKQTDAIEENTKAQEKNSKNSDAAAPKITKRDFVRDAIFLKKQKGEINFDGISPGAQQQIFNDVMDAVERGKIDLIQAVDSFKTQIENLQKSKKVEETPFIIPQEKQDVEEPRKLKEIVSDTKDYTSMTQDELQKCLATEEKWFAKCKEGSEAYERRKKNIEDIQSLLTSPQAEKSADDISGATDQNIISFDRFKKKSKETSDQVISDFSNQEKQVEQLGFNMIRMLSEIGLSYDEYVERLNSQKRGMDWGERLATVVDGKIQDSIKGTQMQVGWSDDLKIDDTISKILHLHPNGKGQHEVFSSEDILGYFDKVLSKGYYDIPFELLQNGQSTSLDFSQMPRHIIPHVITALSQIQAIVDQNLKQNGGKIKSEYDVEYQQLYNSLIKAVMDRYGGKFETDKDISSKIDSKLIKDNFDILEEYTHFIRGDKDGTFHGEDDGSSFMFLQNLFKKLKNGEEIIDNKISPELQKFKEKYEKAILEIKELLQSDRFDRIYEAGMEIALLTGMVNKNHALDEAGHVSRLDEIGDLQSKQMDAELAVSNGKKNPWSEYFKNITEEAKETSSSIEQISKAIKNGEEEALRNAREYKEFTDGRYDVLTDEALVHHQSSVGSKDYPWNYDLDSLESIISYHDEMVDYLNNLEKKINLVKEQGRTFTDEELTSFDTYGNMFLKTMKGYGHWLTDAKELRDRFHDLQDIIYDIQNPSSSNSGSKNSGVQRISEETQEIIKLIDELYRLKDIGDKIDDPISDEFIDNVFQQENIGNKLSKYFGITSNPLDKVNPDYYADQFAEKYGEGIDSVKAKIKEKSFEAGKEAVDGAKEGTEEAQKSKSPSKVAEALGEYWGEGYAKGIRKHKDDVENAVRELVQTGILTTEDLQKDLDTLLSGGFGKKYKALLNPLQNILGGDIDKNKVSTSHQNQHIPEIVYHAGDLSDISKSAKTHTLGVIGEGDHTRRYSGGKEYGSTNVLTGLYTTDSLKDFTWNEWTGKPISTIDISKYNLFKAKSQEEAEALAIFYGHMADVISGIQLKEGSYDELEDISRTIPDLYAEFQKLFGEDALSLQKFESFIKECIDVFKSNDFTFDKQRLLQVDDKMARDNAPYKQGVEQARLGLSNELFNADSFQTQLMKMLGYEGVDLRGSGKGGTYTGGTVLFDVKPESILKTNQPYNDVVPPRLGKQFAISLEEQEKQTELAKESAKAYRDLEESIYHSNEAIKEGTQIPPAEESISNIQAETEALKEEEKQANATADANERVNQTRSPQWLRGQITKRANAIANDPNIDKQGYATLANESAQFVSELERAGEKTDDIKQKFRDITQSTFDRLYPKQEVKTEDSVNEINKETEAVEEMPKAFERTSQSKTEFADANGKVLASIVESVKGLKNEKQAIDALGKLINSLGGNGGEDRLQKTVNGLQEIYKILNSDIGENALVRSLNELASHGADLEKLATVLKSTKKQVENAKKATSAPDTRGSDIIKNVEVGANAKHYLQQFGIPINAAVEDAGKGIVKITSTVLTARDEFKRFTLETTDGINMTIKKEEEKTAGLEKEILLYEKLNRAYGRFVSLDDPNPLATDETFIQKGSALWNQVIEYAKEYGDDLGNILSVTRNVREANGEMLESFKIIGENGSVTIGAENDVVGSVQNIANITKQYQELENVINRLQKLSNDNDQTHKYTDEYIAQVNDMIQRARQEYESPDFVNPEGMSKLIDEANQLLVIAKNTDNMYANMKGIEKIRGKIEDILHDYGAMPRALRGEFEALLDTVKEYIALGDVSKTQADQISADFIRLNSDLSQSGKKYQSMWRQMFERLRSESSQLLARYFSFQDWIRYGRTAITTLIDLDTQLVDLRKTTSMNNTELESFYKNASNVSKQLGVTTSEIISQAAAWSRLGYSTNEAATTMAQLSSKFASVSPGMETSDAQDYLVSTMQAYGVAVDDVERKIMDNVNRIGNTFATTNAEIGEMLKRSSAAMNAANNSLEQTIALESAAVEVTRNAETTGTAFRTVSMRIRGLDEETEDALENYEELKGKIADLTKTDVTPGGVSLFTDASKTEFKSTYQFLKEISDIWDKLTDKKQASLLETIAGKRGAQVLAGLLADFSEVDRAMDEMENAAGSADKEMGIIRDSIEFKINALKQTWVGVLQDISDRGQIGGVIDFLTAVSEGLGSIVSNLGLLKTAIIGIGAVVGSKKLGYCGLSRLRYAPVPRLKPVDKTQRPPRGVGRTSKIKREFYNSRTADMTAWSYAA